MQLDDVKAEKVFVEMTLGSVAGGKHWYIALCMLLSLLLSSQLVYKLGNKQASAFDYCFMAVKELHSVFRGSPAIYWLLNDLRS
ncbi:hypothetical protein GPECTOR_83g269 [Gonium pectorale]|uniref:Uncharacterized protein n=1 Tax=Gonium pectorale TaxID=33097 RepID=A0A150G1E1_GONPE|nr:hypothetical protein GPECTOR_83g269 [Gonium pectorale]|eukprot:KXZ43657.1 hypothetical protein GPECTOR_83g269 [Gonium pectorale]